MKKHEFVKKACAYIATRRSTDPVILNLLDLMCRGICRPCMNKNRKIVDYTEDVILALDKIKVPKKGTCVNGVNIRTGYLIGNDAPRGGKTGCYITVDFPR